MTTQIEEELRELLRDKAAGAPTAVPTTPLAVPKEILRRGRLHQMGTVVGSALIAGLLVLGSVAGLQALVGEASFDTGGSSIERTATVELSGEMEGRSWSVRFTGSFARETECMDFTVSGDTTTLCPTDDVLRRPRPFLHGYDWDGIHLLAGSVPLEVVEVRFRSEKGANPGGDARCESGPSGWTDPNKSVCAIALPAQWAGTVEYLGEDGHVLFEEGMSWGSATASPEPAALPTPVQPTHGGTYWAVYVWLGASGDREAEDVSQMLLERFGIEAHPGDLACDQGAAEALGVGADQGIAVYFETEGDAERFAKQGDLLGVPWDPVAQVTTYCLD